MQYNRVVTSNCDLGDTDGEAICLVRFRRMAKKGLHLAFLQAQTLPVGGGRFFRLRRGQIFLLPIGRG